MTTQIELRPGLLSMRVIATAPDAVYLRLPKELQRDTECSCQHCKRNPELAKWDTLAVPTKANETAWTVHMPDAQVAEFQAYIARKYRKGN